MKKDERYRIAEEAIMTAFMQLARVKRAEKITVSDVAARAGVARSTFYNHYADIESLMEEVENRSLQYIFRMMEGFHISSEEKNTESFFRMFCTSIKEDPFLADLFRRPVEASHFMGKALHMLRRLNSGLGERVSRGNKKEMEYAAAYLIGGVVGVLHKWALSDFAIPQETLARYLTGCLSNGAGRYF